MQFKKNKSAIKIQSLWKGYCLRMKFMKRTDNYTFSILDRCLDRYISNLKFNKKINSLLSRKKRNENFPSDISENIVKFTIALKYHVMPCWDTDKGDLIINKENIYKKIEVKGFMSSGPSSFGPTESWDLLYFVDGQDLYHKRFKVYEIRLSNESKIFKNIKISKKETYENVVNKGKRPRGSFYKIFKPQLGDYCKLIFQGHISELNKGF